MKKIKIRIVKEVEVMITKEDECSHECVHKDRNFEGYCCLFDVFLFYTKDKKGRMRCAECIESEVIG